MKYIPEQNRSINDHIAKEKGGESDSEGWNTAAIVAGVKEAQIGEASLCDSLCSREVSAVDHRNNRNLEKDKIYYFLFNL